MKNCLEQREPIVDEASLEKNKLPTNPIFRAFKAEFSLIFANYNGLPVHEHQKAWYVFERWDTELERDVPEWDSPEARLIEFLKRPVENGPRDIRVIYGGTGCGKTTFLNHLFSDYLVVREHDLAERLFVLRIDLGEAGLNAGDMEEDIDSRTHRELNKQFPWLEKKPHCFDMWLDEAPWDSDFYRELWSDLPKSRVQREQLKWIKRQREHPRLGRKNKTPYGNFNRVRLNYLAKSFGRQVVIIWDNIDQAPLDVQTNALHIAVHKKAWIPDVKIIIAVRPYTIPLLAAEDPASAYRYSDQPLYPPTVHKVLEKRAESTFAAMRENGSERKIDLDNMTITIAHGEAFLRTVLQSFHDRQKEALLCRLTNNNVRKQLDFVDAIIRSRYMSSVNVLDVLHSFYTSKTMVLQIPAHEVLEALICGGYAFRHPGTSLVENIFDCGERRGHRSTLLLHRILEVVRQYASGVECNSMIRILGILGYDSSAVLRCVDRLVRNGMAYRERRRISSARSSEVISISTAGNYYLTDLMYRLIYLQHMAMVTPLSDDLREGLTPWGIHEFSLRVSSAARLLEQISRDEYSEFCYVSKNGDRALQIYNELGFGALACQLAVHALRELERIEKSEGTARRLEVVSWLQLKKPFIALQEEPPLIELNSLSLPTRLRNQVNLVDEIERAKRRCEAALERLAKRHDDGRIGHNAYYTRRVRCLTTLGKMIADLERIKKSEEYK